MRNVTRPDTPTSLRRNAARWRRELCAALSTPTPDCVLVRRRFDRYRQHDIRDSLEEMYGGLCCYCEATIGTVAFGHIEHRRPKRAQPQYAFDWNNMHLACPACNQAKGDKWNNAEPILDSVHDRISEHLVYKLEGGGRRWPQSHRGTTTIGHANLNRQKLLDARTNIALPILDTICILNSDPNSPDAGLIIQELEDKTSGEYGSLVKWLLVHFLHYQPLSRVTHQ